MLSLTLVSTIAAIAGALTAAFTVLKLFTSGIEYLAASFEKARQRRNKRTYILLPTIEEIARYSPKLPDRFEPTKKEVAEYEALVKERYTHRVMSVRIGMLIFAFGFCYTAILLKLVYLGSR